MSKYENETLLELFIFETLELITQLENIALESEYGNAIGEKINEIFRIVHTIKSSASMMNFDNIASLSHSLEDVFYYIRENEPKNVNYSVLTDIVLRGADFIKNAINQFQAGHESIQDVSVIVREINEFLALLKNNDTPIYPQSGNAFSLNNEGLSKHMTIPEKTVLRPLYSLKTAVKWKTSVLLMFCTALKKLLK